MKKPLGILCGALLFMNPAQAVDKSIHDPGKPRLGINFSHIADWNAELAFTDLFRNFRQWTSQGEGPAFNDKRKIDTDENGYVKSLLPGQRVITLYGTGQAGYPKGVYLFTFDGEGTMTFGKGAVKTVTKAPGRWEVECDPAEGAIELTITAVNEKDYPRNMRFIRPGYHDRPEQIFADEWLSYWKEFQVYRFLNWMVINGSPVVEWADRPQPGCAFYSGKKGVPLEVLIELCNQTGAHPWFNIPHQASDDFVRRFAEMVKEKLRPDLVPYVEYSNETWNGQFPQCGYVNAKGRELGLASDWTSGPLYYAKRSMEVHRIWEEVYGGHGRFVRVVQTQAANMPVTKRIFTDPELAKHIDALAVGPYIAMNINDTAGKDTPTKEAFASMTIEEIFKHLNEVMLPNNVFPTRIKANYDFAKGLGLPLIAYEGGQSLTILVKDKQYVADNGWKIPAANKHPLMGELYTRYLNYWKKTGCGTFCAYSSGTGYETMCFGALWAYDTPKEESPKYTALWNYLQSLKNNP